MLSCSTVLLLALFQAANPSPGWTSTSPSYTGRDVKQQGKHNHGTAYPALALAEPVQAVPAEVQRDQKAAYNPQNGIKLTSLPPVTIAEKQKSTMDRVYEWGPWVCNLFLVIVGSLQAVLLWQTREEMHRQARDAREQQRAKLEVHFPPGKPEFVPRKGEDMVVLQGFQVRVSNYGYTEAFKVVAKGHIVTGAEPKKEFTLTTRLNIPSVIRRMNNPETVETTDAITLNFTQEGYISSLNQASVDRLMNGTGHLRMIGLIEYVDVYGTTHESPFDFLWVVKEVTEKGVKVDRSYWMNQSKKTT